ncbi:MAG: 3-phosphoshikimate 1-carboxyvinyltransferase [Desulfovibrio sp.]|uniref:3-phosphoshikimate 1-carboxyvinyltransferase n=1 Tax=Desulfovibrio sp. 7SRBS1 TaxID=3378064 RepID=UPI003B41D83B
MSDATYADPICISAPPSKSVSHRSLIAASMADGVSRISNLLESDDIKATRACLEAGGISVQDDGDALLVTGNPAGMRGGEDEPVTLHMRESGTSCRLFTAVAAAGRGFFRITGEGRMYERPVGALTEVLERQGARIQWQGKPGCPPMVIEARGFAGGNDEVNLEESSQYLSGLLLGAPLARTSMDIGLGGRKTVSWPYVALTLQAMEDFGVKVRIFERTDAGYEETDWRSLKGFKPGQVRFRVEPAAYTPREYSVEADWSSASYFLAAGFLGHPVELTGLRPDSVQGDRAAVDIFKQMGAQVYFDGGTLRIAPGEREGVDVDMGSCPDLVPAVAVAAAFCNSPTRIRNVAHMRLKESDRLAALASQIAKTGCDTKLFPDGLSIDPVKLPAGRELEFTTYGDHRMAMCFSIFELAGIKVRLDNPDCVSKSFPHFWQEWDKIRKGNKL